MTLNAQGPTSPLVALTQAFASPLEWAFDAPAPVVVTTSPVVPLEVIRAAGAIPFVARGSSNATPLADERLEPEIFPSRLRQVMDAALRGALSRAAALVVPRTSDPDYKAFLYLREFARRSPDRFPATLLYDVLQSDSSDVASYSRSRTQQLIDGLAALTRNTVTPSDLAREIARANRARAAVRRLLAFRMAPVRIHGTEVLPLLGAFWRTDPDRYTTLVDAVVAELARRPEIISPRVLLAGSPTDGTNLHACIEAVGAVVVAENSAWGTTAGGPDVDETTEPVQAIADACHRFLPGPRVPVSQHRAWLETALTEIDGVVVWLPPEDTVFGWDYPALRDLLRARNVPHIVIQDDEYLPLTAITRDRVAEFVRRLTRAGGAGRG